MKYLVIFLMTLCLVGAGGAGGYFFFQKQAIASLGTDASEALAKKKAKKDARVASEKEAANLEFVKMDPIILPIIDDQGVSQVVTLVVSLEVDGKERADFVERLSPRLKDAFIQDMYGVLNRTASMNGGVLKVDSLKERLNRVSARVLGEDKVNNVLLQVVNQRAL